MAFTAIDIKEALKNWDGTSTNIYTVPTYNYLPGRLYLMFVEGNDSTGVSADNAVGVPVTAGIVWAEETRSKRDFGALTLYTGTIASEASVTTEVTFPTVQTLCTWFLAEINNADVTIVQSNVAGWNALSGSVTLSATIAADGLALLAVTHINGLASTFALGADQVAITGTYGNIFGEYNLILDESMPVGTPTGGSHVAIAVEVAFAATASVTITSVNGGSTIADGETPVTILGTNFELSGNTVVISPIDDISDPSATSITPITEGSTTTIVITVELPTGSTSDDPVYVFVDNGVLAASDGFSVNVTAPITPTLVTALFEESSPTVVVNATALVSGTRYEILDPGTTDFTTVGAVDSAIGTRFRATGVATGTGTTYQVDPVICESVLNDFASGLSVWIMRAGVTKEEATVVTAISSVPTSTLQLFATFPNGDPVLGDSDEVVIAYTQNGNLRSVTGSRELPTSEFTGETCA